MTHEEYKAAADHWIEKDAVSKKMPEDEKTPVDALKKLPFTMNLIKIIPTEIDFLNSDFKEKGYDSRQHYVCGGKL